MILNELNTRCAMDEYIQSLKDENNRLKEMLYESAIQEEWPARNAHLEIVKGR